METWRWHLEQAERLLAEADKADEDPDRPIWTRYSYVDRSQAHVALARAMKDMLGPSRPLGPPRPPGRT